MAETSPPLTLLDWLDDLCVRFLLNLPASELSSVPRLCFQVEEAQWFYEDFVRPAVQATGATPLPSLSLRQFCLLLFQHCPLFSRYTDAEHLAAYEEFLAYKVRVPVRGAILLDERMEKLVLVRGWKKGASWSFPRGKINKDEGDLACAIREVYEETGYDISTSGLLPENEEDVKYIDITMREQHMRLFVFRGVPEDTYFETKTRKEISKIAWYHIKDLPGFKKYNKREDESVQASKFYMVAPFLGPLKKWINGQRKKDVFEAQRAARSSLAHASVTEETGTEDEVDEQQQQYVDESDVMSDHKTEDLKRLLSIGGSVPTAKTQPAQVDTGPANLLALLQGGPKPTNGGQLPRTPFDQVDAFPQQPGPPQPQHLRHPSMGQQQQGPPPPQFPFSPQRMQEEQQRNYPPPPPHVFGPGPPPMNYPPYAPRGLPTGMRPHHFQQHSLQQHPFHQPPPHLQGPNPGLAFQHQNNTHFTPPPHPPQMQTAQNLPPHMQQPYPPHLMAQGPQGPMASGPAAPNASQLPAPRLNPHTMKLLDSFRGGSTTAPQATTTSTRPGGVPRATSTHQAALLDLFRKPSATASPVAAPQAADEPASPTLTDVTEKPRRPSKAQEKRPTLNEITRTLPLKPKVKSPVPTSPAGPHESTQPRERRLFDPENPSRSISSRPLEEPASVSPVRILQRPGSKQERSRSPLPAKQANARSAQNGQTASPFTLLTRPGSSKGPKSPAFAAPASPLEKPSFQPRVLKRPGAQNGLGIGVDAEVGDGEKKKKQLLALFGKAQENKGTASSATETPLGNTAERDLPQTTIGPQNALLDLFNTTSQPQPEQEPIPPSEPPPAPRITPSPSSKPSSNPQQDLLMNLFTKSADLASPGTPISPFTLGTPVTSQAPGRPVGKRTGIGGTPVEAKEKEFLKGYLDGIVKGAGVGKR